MVLVALALIVLGRPAAFAPSALRRASPELASIAGERRREGLRYERLPEGLRYERAVDLILRGTVLDQSGLPVPRALVYIDGTQTSTETDSTGRFALALNPVQAGTLTIFRDGFSPVTVAFDPLDPLTLETFRIVLTPAPVTEMVTVTAPRTLAPRTSPQAFEMRPLDVVRTPGSAADLMRALQTLPGVAQVDEGAGLYVRGGDTSEVLVLLVSCLRKSLVLRSTAWVPCAACREHATTSR